MSPEQIAAFNQAVADFTAAQQLQQAGNNAGAIAKYEGALPAIRTAVKMQPNNADYTKFLANALYATAAAQASVQNFDAFISLYKEAVPLWRGIVAANPTDATSRNILAGMLVQLGNKALSTQDKATAGTYYTEATALARKSVAAAPADPVNKNLLLSSLIGLSQTSTDKAVMDEVLAMGKRMLAEGSIDAVNKPSIEIMTGAKG
jgi:tetratricopeptide (TPR) repeat protein